MNDQIQNTFFVMILVLFLPCLDLSWDYDIWRDRKRWGTSEKKGAVLLVQSAAGKKRRGKTQIRTAQANPNPNPNPNRY